MILTGPSAVADSFLDYTNCMDSTDIGDDFGVNSHYYPVEYVYQRSQSILHTYTAPKLSQNFCGSLCYRCRRRYCSC